MNANLGVRRRWLWTVCGAALGVAASGCSMLIAQSGVSGVAELYKPETRAEVRERFGEADETGTCPDGRGMERRSIWQRVTWICKQPSGFAAETGCEGLREAYYWSLGLADVLAIPFQLYRSEQAKLHYAFVYGDDDRVLYRYDVTASPPGRFREAVGPLVYSVARQLEEGGCPGWGMCLSAYAEEARRRAACVGYALTPEDEGTFQRVHAIAADVDAGRIPKDDALAEIEACVGLRGPLVSCVPPAPSPSNPTPAGGPPPGE